MKVILKENIKGIGKKFEVKNVSDGYANNFLIPKKLAEYASPEVIKKVELLKANAIAEMEIKENLTKKQIEGLHEIKVTLNKKANDKGHLFEKIHIEEISQALKDQFKIEFDIECINLTSPIKELGEHLVQVEVGKNKGEFVLVVTPA